MNRRSFFASLAGVAAGFKAMADAKPAIPNPMPSEIKVPDERFFFSADCHTQWEVEISNLKTLLTLHQSSRDRFPPPIGIPGEAFTIDYFHARYELPLFCESGTRFILVGSNSYEHRQGLCYRETYFERFITDLVHCSFP